MKKIASVFILLLSFCQIEAATVDFPHDLPTEVGMYHKDATGDWQEVQANIFNWQTGGVLKSAASLGIVKGDLNAKVWGQAAPHSASYQQEFLVVVPQGVSIGEYQMIELHQHRKSREFRMLTGGVFHKSSGPSRDEQKFVSRRVAPSTYVISFSSYQGGGEFGFLPPPSFDPTPYASGRIYCFEMRN